VTSTGAGDDAMEVEAVGDTAEGHGDDAEAGARMDCDDDGEEGGVPWATVPWAALNYNSDSSPSQTGVTVPPRAVIELTLMRVDSTSASESVVVSRMNVQSPNPAVSSGPESVADSDSASAWRTVPWAAGSLHFQRQPPATDHLAAGQVNQSSPSHTDRNPSTKPKKKKQRGPAYAARNYARDPASRTDRRRAADGTVIDDTGF